MRVCTLRLKIRMQQRIKWLKGKHRNQTPAAKRICNQITIIQIWLSRLCLPHFLVWPLFLQAVIGLVCVRAESWAPTKDADSACWRRCGIWGIESQGGPRTMLLFPYPIFSSMYDRNVVWWLVVWNMIITISDFSWKFGLGWQKYRKLWYASNYLVTKCDFVI